MGYLVTKTTIEESTGLVSTTEAGHLALHNDKAQAVNSLADEMIDARNPELASPAATATSVPELLGQIKQMLKNVTGESNWYGAVAATISSIVSSVSNLTSTFNSHNHTSVPQIPTAGIENVAVTTAKIASKAVTPVKMGDRLIGEGALEVNVDVVTTDQPKDLISLEVEVSRDDARISVYAFHTVQKLTAAGWIGLGLVVDSSQVKLALADGAINDWNELSIVYSTTLSVGSHTIKTQGVTQINTGRFEDYITAGGFEADASGLFVYEG